MSSLRRTAKSSGKRLAWRRLSEELGRRQSPFGESLDFLRLLWALDHGLQTRSRRMARKLGVTGPQRFALRIVGKIPGISPSELAAILHVHRSTVTPLLKRLVSRGFLSRRRDREDGRRAILELTARGRRADQTSADTVEATVRSVLSRTPQGRIREGSALLSSMGRALNAGVEFRGEAE